MVSLRIKSINKWLLALMYLLCVQQVTVVYSGKASFDAQVQALL